MSRLPEPRSADGDLREGRPLLMFGSLTWGGILYSRHHLTVGLARRHPIILVDPAEELRVVLGNPANFLRPATMRAEQPGIFRYVPPGWLPEVYRWPRLGAAFRRRRAGSLLRALKQPAASRALCYVWDPGHRQTVEPLSHLPLVYHCYDKYDRYTNAPAEIVRADEEWLARRAVICFAASVKLGEHLTELGARDVVILRHGVDTEVFRPGASVPPELDRIPRPRLGVVARMNEAVDIEALLRIAAERPSWSLVLLGGEYFTDEEKQTRFKRLVGLPNVHYFGSQPAEAVPRWLGGMDAGLVCYDLASWAPFNQPIKTYEYLAAGLPVVSTDITASRELGDLIERCGSPESWVPAIERALSRQSPTEIGERLGFARENSWQRRVEEIEARLAQLP